MKRTLIKICYLIIIFTSVLLGIYVNHNFTYIAKSIFWFESVIGILSLFCTNETLLKNRCYVTKFQFIFNVFNSVLAVFLIAYYGWFVLLNVYIAATFILGSRTIMLNKLSREKDLKDKQ